jgi:regulator of sirC expression with transglutaminase-like and TPR domain
MSNQLPFLLHLIDDESSSVRRAVATAILDLGEGLSRQVAALDPQPNRAQLEAFGLLVDDPSTYLLRLDWDCWQELEEENERLEAALEQISRFCGQRPHDAALTAVLDRLAREYDGAHAEREAKSLAAFLFREDEGLRGNREDYYNPLNSDLAHVITSRLGIPISLVCVYILVAERLDIEVEGCNVPGHFLARIETDDGALLIDCFNGGRVLDGRIMLGDPSGNKGARFIDSANLLASADDIIVRVLRNLVNAYERSEDEGRAAFMRELLEDLGAEPEPTPGSEDRPTESSQTDEDSGPSEPEADEWDEQGPSDGKA